MPRTARVRDPVRYKTVLCNTFASTGACPYKHKCQFAHGVEELRERSTPIAAPKLGSTQGLKMKTTELARAIGADPDLSIPDVIEAANRRFGLQERLDKLATLPQKVDHCLAVAALVLTPRKRPAPVSIGEDVALFVDGAAARTALPQLHCLECTGKVEAHDCAAPLPKREVSHHTELVRRAISFVFDDTDEMDDFLPRCGAVTVAPRFVTPIPAAGAA